MKRILLVTALLILGGSVSWANAAKHSGKNVYIILPKNYVYRDGELLTADTFRTDNFCRIMENLQDKIEAAGFHMVPTTLETKPDNFAGLIACDLPENIKKLKKYPRSKMLFLRRGNVEDQETVDKYFGEVFKLHDNIKPLLDYLDIPLVADKDDDDDRDDENDEIDPLIISIIMGPASIEKGSKATLSVITDGGKEPLMFSWSDGQEGQNLSSITVSPEETTEYLVSVRDSSKPRMKATTHPFVLKVEPKKAVEKPAVAPAPVAQAPAPVKPAVPALPVQQPKAPTELKLPTKPAPALPSLTHVAIEGKRAFKTDETIQLKAQPDGATYSWSGPQNFAATTQKISLIAKPRNAGNYTVKVTAGTESKTATAAITVSGPDMTESKQTVAQQKEVVPTKPLVPKKRSPLIIIKTRDFKFAEDIVTFTLAILNTSDMDVSNVVVNDVLPSCLALRSVEGLQWRIVATDDGFNAQTQSLLANQSKTLVVTAQYIADPRNAIYNLATIKSDQSSLRHSRALLI